MQQLIKASVYSAVFLSAACATTAPKIERVTAGQTNDPNRATLDLRGIREASVVVQGPSGAISFTGTDKASLRQTVAPGTYRAVFRFNVSNELANEDCAPSGQDTLQATEAIVRTAGLAAPVFGALLVACAVKKIGGRFKDRPVPCLQVQFKARRGRTYFPRSDRQSLGYASRLNRPHGRHCHARGLQRL